MRALKDGQQHEQGLSTLFKGSCASSIQLSRTLPNTYHIIAVEVGWKLDSRGLYRDEIYSLQILLSKTQAGPGGTDKQQQE